MIDLAKQSVREHLSLDVQRELVGQVRQICEASPLVRPVARGGRPMSVRVTGAGALGWVGDGDYHYSPRDRRGNPWPPIPKQWTEIADRVAGEHPWDCAIVNWYEPGAILGWHRDSAERDRTLPIVTISLGDAASWAVRLDEETQIHRCRLESGDVTLLCEEHGTRNALHTIERLIAAPMFSPLASPGRLSITLRCAG